MTADELRHKFNTEFGLNPWPKTYEVDAATYGYVCQDVINNLESIGARMIFEDKCCVSIGPNNGILFKNVELIIK